MSNANLDSQLTKLRIDKSRKRSRGASRRWILVLAAVGLAIAGWASYRASQSPLQVRTAVAEKEVSEAGRGPALVTASGYVVPRQNIEVSSKVMGRIVELNIKRGDVVKKGDVLLRIEDNEYKARVLSADAQVASLKARVAELKAGSRPQEIDAAEAAVSSAQATLRSAELDLKRVEALFDRGAISKQELDRARAAYDVAKSSVDSDKSTLNLVKAGPRREQIEAAEAQLREAEAGRELAKTELEYTIIRAPIDGTILDKLAELGEMVTNTNFGGTRGAKNSVVTMADLSDMQVEIDVNESELGKVKVGQQAEIRLDMNPDKPYLGVVDEVAPQADRQKGTVEVKVRVTNPDDLIRPEVNARVTFLGEAPADGKSDAAGRVWVPKSAIVHEDKNTFVFVAANDKAVKTPVTLGAEGELGAEVVKGLSGGERVVTSPLEQVKDGRRIAVAQ